MAKCYHDTYPGPCDHGYCERIESLQSRLAAAEAEMDRLQRKLNEKTVELGAAYEIAENREIRLAAADRLADEVFYAFPVLPAGAPGGMPPRLREAHAAYEAAREGEEG